MVYAQHGIPQLDLDIQTGAYVAGSGCRGKQFKTNATAVIKAHVLDLRYTLAHFQYSDASHSIHVEHIKFV